MCKTCWIANEESKADDRIVIATTVAAGNDEIVQVCTKNGIDCFRGSENDVLDRYYQTACKLGCKP